MGLAVTINRKTSRVRVADEAKKQADSAKPAAERVEDYLLVDPMEVEIGVGLIRLADPKRGGDLLQRIDRIRQNVAAELGIILPKVRIRDSFQLDQHQYRIKIADMPVAAGSLQPASLLAMDSEMTTGKVPGMPTSSPPSARRPSGFTLRSAKQAEVNGYTVVEPGAVVATVPHPSHPQPRL